MAMLLILLCVLSCLLSTHTYAHSDLLLEKAKFSVEQRVNVFLVGFEGQGVDPVRLRRLLRNLLPTRSPHCMLEGKAQKFEYVLDFNVQPPSSSSFVEETIVHGILEHHRVYGEDGKKDDEGADDVENFEVEMRHFEDLLSAFDAGANPSIVLLHPSKSNIWNAVRKEIPSLTSPSTFAYGYRSGASLTRSWVSASHWVIYDFTAGPFAYGPTLGGEGGGVAAVDMYVGNNAAETMASVAKVVVSAVQHVLLPDAAHCAIDKHERTVVAVMVLRDHDEFSPLASAADVDEEMRPYLIDMDVVRERAQLFAAPGTRVDVVAGVHNLHDHPHLQTALHRAVRKQARHRLADDGTYHVYSEPFLDGRVLLEQLAHASDLLAAGLLGAPNGISASELFAASGDGKLPSEDEALAAILRHTTRAEAAAAGGGGAWPEADRKRGQTLLEQVDARDANAREHAPRLHDAVDGDVRVVPVYVFSLLSFGANLLLDGDRLLQHNRHAAVVLQTGDDAVRLPYFADLAPVTADARRCTRSVVASIAHVLGAVSDPSVRHSAPHGGPVHDYTWAGGHHPFGPFSTSLAVSREFSDAALRNRVVARISDAVERVEAAIDVIDRFAAQYAFNPFGRRLEQAQSAKAGLQALTHRAEHGGASVAAKLLRVAQLPLGLHMPMSLVADMFEHPEQFDQGVMPSETVRMLHDRVNEVDTALREAADDFGQHNLEAALQVSDYLQELANAFVDYADDEVYRATERLACCKQVHAGEQRGMSWFAIGTVVLLLIACCATVARIFSVIS